MVKKVSDRNAMKQGTNENKSIKVTEWGDVRIYAKLYHPNVFPRKFARTCQRISLYEVKSQLMTHCLFNGDGNAKIKLRNGVMSPFIGILK